jgi:hypothetical protein
MRSKPSRCIVRALCCALPFLLAAAASAQWLRSQPRPLDGLVRSDPRLFSNDAMEPVAEAASELDAKTVRAWDLFQIAATGEWQAYSNRSTGRVEMVEGAGIPWIPGTGNQLVRSDLAGLWTPRPAPCWSLPTSTATGR